MVRFLNSRAEGNGVRSVQDVHDLLQSVRFTGSTPLGRSLRSKVLNEMVYSQPRLVKPVSVYVITDGEPDDRADVLRALVECRDRMSRTPFGARAVGFQFAQVSQPWCYQRHHVTDF
jgi:hypothetical protein